MLSEWVATGRSKHACVRVMSCVSPGPTSVPGAHRPWVALGPGEGWWWFSPLRIESSPGSCFLCGPALLPWLSPPATSSSFFQEVFVVDRNFTCIILFKPQLPLISDKEVESEK